MTALDDVLAANREAAKRFFATARGVAKENWSRPVAPGKRSRAQIAEHVAVTNEVLLRAIQGDKSMGSIPAFLRPLPRALIFNPIIRKGVFPAKSRAPAIFEPSKEHVALDDSAARLERAMAAVEAETRRLAAAGTHTFDHGFFGRLAITDYLRFNQLHTDHHERQMR